MAAPVSTEYSNQMKAEKDNLDPSVFVHASRLLAEEIDKVERGIKYTEVHNDRKSKLAVKVAIPTKEYPKINFVGKLMGPGGMSIKRLQAETGCKMSIMGKGSMKDRKKEEEMRKSGDPKYNHLAEDLHVMVEVFAEAHDAYARMANAMTELAKYMQPDFQDEAAMEFLNGGQMGAPHEMEGGHMGMSRGRGRGRGGMRGHPPAGGPHHATGATRGGMGAAALLQTPGARGRGAPRGAPARGMPTRGARGAPRGRGGMPPARAAPAYQAEEAAYQQPYDEQGYGEYDQTYAAEPAAYAQPEEQYFDYGAEAAARPAQQQGFEAGNGNGYYAPPARADPYATAAYKAPPARGKTDFRAHPYSAPRGGAPRY